MSSSQPTIGRGLLSVVGLTTTIGCFIADWNVSHIYNPNWAPHAKFHNGQTMSMGACLGLSTFYYTWRKSPTTAAANDSLKTAVWLGSMYWITQLSAILYPGSLAIDPEFGEGFPQAYICLAQFTFLGLGYWFESSRLNVGKVGTKKKL